MTEHRGRASPMSPHVRPPVEYRVGDRLRLRKVHPCGGWTWTVVRLGADIGLVCETCGRRVLLDRTTLEKRTKTILERGAETPQPDSGAVADGPDRFPVFDLSTGQVLIATRPVAVSVTCYFSSNIELASGRLTEGDAVKIVILPSGDSGDVTLEPVDYSLFETRFVPGGIRSQESYTGYAIVLDWRDLARNFARIESDLEASEAEQGRY